MATNFWFRPVINAYLLACSRGEDWRAAVAKAVEALDERSSEVVTHKDFRPIGIPYSRQHINRKVRDGTFPAPFNLPSSGESR